MRVSRRGLLSMGAAIAASTTLSGCGALSRTSAVTSEKVMSSDTIRIGASLELSGANAVFGRLQERAIAIALAELNVEGIRVGDSYRRLEIVTRDNRGDAATAAQVAQELADAKVCAIIGGISAEAALATIKVTENKHLPYLSMCAADSVAIPLSTRKFTYKLAPNSTDVATRLARQMRTSGQKNVVIVSTSDLLGHDGSRAIAAALVAADRRLADQVTLPSSGKDYAGAAARAIGNKPDAVVIWTSAPNATHAVAAIREADPDVAIYLPPSAIDDETLTNKTAANMRNVFVCYSPVLAGAPFIVNTASGRATRTFVNRYTQEYGSFSGCMPFAADALSLVAAAARRASTVDPKRLRGALESTPYDGVAGSYGFSPIDHGGMAPEVLVIFASQHKSWVRL
jgi:branched-chain amino acid transport system substrate-binding protein